VNTHYQTSDRGQIRSKIQKNHQNSGLAQDPGNKQGKDAYLRHLRAIDKLCSLGRGFTHISNGRLKRCGLFLEWRVKQSSSLHKKRFGQGAVVTQRNAVRKKTEKCDGRHFFSSYFWVIPVDRLDSGII
jgi:hypothetical protein